MEKKETLLTRLREAFQGVVLGDGLCLAEARALDDHASQDELAIARANDVECRTDWTQLIGATTFYRNVGLDMISLDDVGYRYFLPGYLSTRLIQLPDFYPVSLFFRFDQATKCSDGTFTSAQLQVLADCARYFESLAKGDKCWSECLSEWSETCAVLASMAESHPDNASN